MQLCIAYVLLVDPKSHMPKMSQIHEELRAPEGHKHTYIHKQLYILCIENG